MAGRGRKSSSRVTRVLLGAAAPAGCGSGEPAATLLAVISVAVGILNAASTTD